MDGHMTAIHHSAATVRPSSRVTIGVLAVGAALAVVVAVFASQGHDRSSLAVAVALPLVIVLLRYPWAGVLLWLAVMPFLAIGDGAAGPETWLFDRLLVPTVLALALGYRLVGLSRSYFRLSVTDLALAAFIVVALANIWMLSSDTMRNTAAFYNLVMIPIAIYWLVRVIEPRERELKWLLWIMAALVVIQFAVGVLSWLAPSVLPAQWLGRAGERTVGTVRGPAMYSTTLMVGGMMAMAYLSTVRGQLARWALFGIVALAFIGIGISFSRGSWAGAALVLLGLLFVRRRIALGLLAVGLVALGAVAAVNFGGIVAYATARLSDADTAESRLVTNNAALRMIQARPLTGFGYGNFELFDESYKVRIGDLPAEEGSAHHTFLALAAENGLPALLLYLFPAAWLLWLTLRRWRQVTSRDPLHGPLLVGLWLGILHEATVMQFMDMLHSSTWGTGLWWLMLGLIHVIISRGSRPANVVRVGWTVPADLRQ
jgi:O-antigen ligase